MSLSLLETTALCRELTGNAVPVERRPRSAPGRRAHLPLGLRAAVRPARTGARAATPARGAGGHARLDRRQRARRAGGPDWLGRAWPIAIVTGSGGPGRLRDRRALRAGRLRRGRPRERHAGARSSGPTRPRGPSPSGCVRAVPGRSARSTSTSATPTACERVFAEHGGADRAGRAHRGAALARLGGVGPADRLRRERQRHAQPARGHAPPRPDAPFVFISTNKVYGDTPEPPAARGARARGSSCRRTTATSAASTPR